METRGDTRAKGRVGVQAVFPGGRLVIGIVEAEHGEAAKEKGRGVLVDGKKGDKRDGWMDGGECGMGAYPLQVRPSRVRPPVNSLETQYADPPVISMESIYPFCIFPRSKPILNLMVPSSETSNGKVAYQRLTAGCLKCAASLTSMTSTFLASAERHLVTS